MDRKYRYFLKLCYDGRAYHGWQAQKNAPGIQHIIEEKLGTILKETASITGAGRTDTGVHARAYYAHFDSKLDPDSLIRKNLRYKLNRMLPGDIAIEKVLHVDDSLHARFSALSRTYQYIICTQKSPFWAGRAWYYERPLDVNAMQSASELLKTQNNFKSFSKSNTDVNTFLCDIKMAEWATSGYILTFTIQADRFLRNMVRAIVGTMVRVGEGKTSLNEFNMIIESQNRQKAGYSVPGHGLYLISVEYPQGILEESHDVS